MSFRSSPVRSDELDDVFREAGMHGCLHVLDIDSGAEISLRGNDVCFSASVGKVPVLVALMQAVAAGTLKLEEQIDMPAGDRTGGPAGLSAMAYPARLALGDIAQLMMSVSDNHATDVVLQRVPPGQVTAAMRDLGLTVTTLETTIKEFYARVVAGDIDPRPEVAHWRTTPAEMCRLLQAIWRDEAAPAAQCERMRALMRSCATSNGLDGGLPLDVQMTSGRKTGTLIGIEGEGEKRTVMLMRNEVGVVEFPDGRRYAVAVFTHAEGADLRIRDAAASRTLGTAVRMAIDGLS